MYSVTFNTCHNPTNFSDHHFMDEEMGSEVNRPKRYGW